MDINVNNTATTFDESRIAIVTVGNFFNCRREGGPHIDSPVGYDVRLTLVDGETKFFHCWDLVHWDANLIDEERLDDAEVRTWGRLPEELREVILKKLNSQN